MTTPSSAASTTSTPSTKDNPVIHSNLDDNRQTGDYTDNQDDEHFYSLPSSNDDMVAVQASSHCNRYSSRQDEQPTKSPPLIASNQTSVYEPILSSEAGSNICIPYGVDWSDRARLSSHCWFPFTCNDASAAQPCEYVSCTERTSTRQSTILQCGSCALVVHSHHLNDLKVTSADFIPPCRPSFVDNTTPGNSLLNSKENSSKYDEHFWSHVSILSIPCAYCQQASAAKSLFGSGHGQLLMMSPSEILDQVTSFMSSISADFNPKMSSSSRGLVCLWCSRGYHQSCWEQLAAHDNQIQCDYGIFQNIIVRPQWLSRSSESSTSFKATIPLHSENNNSKSNSIPYTPVIAFINKRSGGQIGEKIYRELLRKLNPRQIFLLENNDTITHALKIYSSLPNIRICVFGGDGTVGWILGRLAEAYPSKNNPPVGIGPLGTGNDLSRVLGWGEQYDPKRLFETLLQIPLAQVVALDRWQVQLEQLDASAFASSARQYRETGFSIDRIFKPLFDDPKFARETNRACYENYQKLPNTRFINYMSFGLDAAIALEFHDQRTRDPSKFSSPLKNKLMYLNESCKYFNDFARANIWNLGSYIRLICDGQDLTDTIYNCHTLVLLNIPGYASGTNPWGNSFLESSITGNTYQSSVIQKDSDSVDYQPTGSTDLFKSLSDTEKTYTLANLNDCGTNELETSSTTTAASHDRFERQDFGDRKIEVVGLSTTHMAAIHVGFCGNRIAQCHRLRIELCCPMTAQMDGEPFYLPASVAVNINHAGQVLVSKNQTK